MNIPETYNQSFIDFFNNMERAYNDAGKYGVTILPPNPLPNPGESCWRVIGIHHLTGAENHGQHNAFCDVLDEAGQRVHLARINILSNGQPRPDPSYMVIDKPANEPGTNTQMHWNDTLTLWVDRDGLPSERVDGLHTRHDDEEAGTTRGHHSYYVVWHLGVWSESTPEPEPDPTPDPDPDPPPPTGDWRDLFTPTQLTLIDLILEDVDLFAEMTKVIKKFADWADGNS